MTAGSPPARASTPGASPRDAAPAPQYPPGGDDAPTDAGAEGEDEHLVATLGGAVQDLAEGGHVGVVVDGHGQAASLLQGRAEDQALDARDVGGVADAALEVDHPRHPDSHR